MYVWRVWDRELRAHDTHEITGGRLTCLTCRTGALASGLCASCYGAACTVFRRCVFACWLHFGVHCGVKELQRRRGVRDQPTGSSSRHAFFAHSSVGPPGVSCFLLSFWVVGCLRDFWCDGAPFCLVELTAAAKSTGGVVLWSGRKRRRKKRQKATGR